MDELWIKNHTIVNVVITHSASGVVIATPLWFGTSNIEQFFKSRGWGIVSVSEPYIEWNGKIWPSTVSGTEVALEILRRSILNG